jgi:hypothetical protein
VLAGALMLVAPVFLWRNAPGKRLAFQTTCARLAVWHGGLPASGEPLLALEPLGAHAPALATLIADLSELGAGDPGRAAAVVVAAAAALVVVGLFALHSIWVSPEAAALGTLAGLALAPWPSWLSMWGDVEALVALAFVLPGLSLVVGHRSRSSGVAAALLLAAGALSQPALTALAVLVGLLPLLRRPDRARALGRSAWVGGVALALAAPGLLPLARALSPHEAAAIARSPRLLELATFGLGALCVGLAPLALRRRGSPCGRLRCGLALAAVLLLVLRVHGWFAAGQLRPETLSALELVAERTPSLTVVCAPEGIRDFVPALAGRRAGGRGAWVPPVYSDEWARAEHPPCAVDLGDAKKLQ